MRKTRIEDTPEFLELAQKMDSRDRFFKELQKFFDTHGKIPDNYRKEWSVYIRDPRPWRANKIAYRRIKAAAKEMRKNREKLPD